MHAMDNLCLFSNTRTACLRYATADKEWLSSVGWPLVKGIAAFYAARVEPMENGTYALNMVMGPDEVRACVRACVGVQRKRACTCV